MHTARTRTNPKQPLRSPAEAAIAKTFFLLSLGWVALLLVLAGINGWAAYTNTLSIVQHAAIDSFQKDTVYRFWATSHGGVYVPVTEDTPPNPYLAHIPERDITTPLGKKLTLVNPAYMTRQVHTLGLKKYGLRGHITSLKPIRPENEPDRWEREALEAFDKGAKEACEIIPLSGRPYLRYMRPFITEQGCLKCHASQGYKLGDIRGGVSVSVPWWPSRDKLVSQLMLLAGAYGLICFVGLWGLKSGYHRTMSLLRKQRQIEQDLRNKNEELGGFNRMVSHDLKSPLVTIRTFLGFLERDIAAGETSRVETSLQHMRLASEKMNSLVSELLALSRVEQAGKPSVETPLQELVREAAGLVAGQIEKRGVRVQVSPEPVLLYGDRARLVTVFQNLIDNAVKYMGDQDDPCIEIGAETETGGAVVFVRDNGMGIQSQHINSIFSLFNKINEESEGLGIGLAMVQRIIEMQGGSIWVESGGLGKGSCFRFRLPKKEVQG